MTSIDRAGQPWVKPGDDGSGWVNLVGTCASPPTISVPTSMRGGRVRGAAIARGRALARKFRAEVGARRVDPLATFFGESSHTFGK